MTAYFKDCKCTEDVKEAYRKYAKALHPDNGGDAEEFKRMQAAYTAAFERFKYTHRKADRNTAGNDHADDHSANEHYKESYTAEAFAKVIDSIIGLDGVEIEIVGSWIWLSGNTYPYREQIKEAGFFWSSKHKKWYYSGDRRKSKKHSKLSFDEVRALHGSHEIRSPFRPKLT
jgi:curved DNA-binding protein CbpA